MKAANLLGDNTFLLEQLGFGHTSIAQFSSCTLGIMINYFVNSTVVISAYPDSVLVLIGFIFFSFQKDGARNARSMMPISSPY